MFKVQNILRSKTNYVYNCMIPKRLFFKRLLKSAATDSSKSTDKKDTTKSVESDNCKEQKSDAGRRIKVCIIGGGSTAPLYTSLLLKQSSNIKSIHLIDGQSLLLVNALDANHIDTSARVKVFPKTKIIQALDKVDIVALMDETFDILDNTNFISKFREATKYIRETTELLAENNPDALVAVFMRPVTAMLPMVFEIYNWVGTGNPNKIIGSTALYSMRMDATTARFLDLNPEFISVPLCCGADATTVVPLLSRAKPFNEFTNAQVDTLLRSFRNTDCGIGQKGSRVPSLASGAAAAKLILALAAGLRGQNNATACAYVRSNILSGCQFFTSNLQFGEHGIEKNFGLPKVSPVEVSLIDQAIPLINEYTEIGINTVRADRRGKLKSL